MDDLVLKSGCIVLAIFYFFGVWVFEEAALNGKIEQGTPEWKKHLLFAFWPLVFVFYVLRKVGRQL